MLDWGPASGRILRMFLHMPAFDLGDFFVIRNNLVSSLGAGRATIKQSAMDSDRRVLGLRRHEYRFPLHAKQVPAIPSLLPPCRSHAVRNTQLTLWLYD